jgi:hypothetical protein
VRLVPINSRGLATNSGSANQHNCGTWCLGATLLKYTGRRFAVYAVEQNVTRITQWCDQQYGWSVRWMAG